MSTWIPKLILVCDDDASYRRRLARSLLDRGAGVLEAANAQEALDSFESNDPDAVLVDLRMPGENGLWLVARIHARNPRVPIVVLTGFGSISTAMTAVRLGAHQYLTKPASIDHILAAFGPQAHASSSVLPMPSLAQIEAEYVQRVVDECDGNVTKSAKVLGVHRRSLQRKLRK